MRRRAILEDSMEQPPLEKPKTTISFAGGKTYTLDKYAFLDPPDQWDEEFAEGMAVVLGITGGLTPEHWEFIKYLRRIFIKEKRIPLVVDACAENKLKLDKLARLFPAGYHRGACKIAGINYAFMHENNIWRTNENYYLLHSQYKLTALGFLESFNQWDNNFAQLLANERKLPHGLTAKHWQIIYYLRDFYSKTNNIPTVFEACRTNDIDLNDLNELFPDGYRRGACRMAGLPFFA